LLVTSARYEALIADLLHILGDGRQSLGRRLSSGPALAADLLEDGLAAQRTGFERSLVQVLLSVTEYPAVADLRGIAATLDGLLYGRYRSLVLSGSPGPPTPAAAPRQGWSSTS
jgi:hypothetical protein